MPTSEPTSGSSAPRVNVLLTCAGEKSYLVETFAASPRLGRLVATDGDPRAPIAGHAPVFRAVPPVAAAEAYLDALAELCREHEIHLLLPQNDRDLELLAGARARFADLGTRIAGAAPETVRTSCDKLEVGSWLAEHGLAYPRTHDAAAGDSPLPAIVKPRFGQGSEGLRRARTLADLADLPSDMVVQELVEGPEYNLDILRGDNGVVAVVPKLKLAMRWGSTHQAVAVDRPDLVELGVRLGDAVAHLGSIDVDLIDGERGPVVLDINPRIGGGFPFTALFCPAYVDALLAIGRGERPTPFLGRYRGGVRATRELRFFVQPASDTITR